MYFIEPHRFCGEGVVLLVKDFFLLGEVLNMEALKQIEMEAIYCTLLLCPIFVVTKHFLSKGQSWVLGTRFLLLC